jgi:CHRD domain
MRKLVLALTVAVVGALTIVGAMALAHGNNGRTFSAKLTGYEETPAAESTPGHGSIRLRITGGGTGIHYRLHYEDFEAAEGATLFAHIHFGARATSGGVSAFLCGGGDKPPCTPLQGTFEGDIDAADVIGPSGQGIAPGELAELIRAMRKGVTYANVHTTLNPAGLIRGQIDKGHGHGRKGGDDKK